MGLETYKKKRNFSNTPEPEEGASKRSAVLHFVIQRHDASHLHYDFRLELDGVLKSWAVPKGPSMKAGEKRLAVQVEDHPVSYGSFTGEIPEGNYGAGIVEVWDKGSYKPLEKVASAEKHFLKQLEKGDLKFILKGKHLNGAFALVRMNDGTGKNWLLIKKSDEFAQKTYNIASIDPVKPFKKKAVKAKKEKLKTPPEAEEADIPAEKIEAAWKKLRQPMLARLVSAIEDNDQWLFETKYDGYRAVTKIAGGRAEMVSRNGNSFNAQYSPLIEALEVIEDEVILDGEVVIEDNKHISNFQLLQNYITTGKGTLKYYVFDILYINGHRTIDMPLTLRKELLEAFFKKYKLTHVHLGGFTVGKGMQLFKKLAASGQEGIIAKAADSVYIPGKRSDNWYKLKETLSQEAVICGYTLPQKSRKYFGSLILGTYEKGKLKYIGNCGTGFTDISLKSLFTRFSKLETNTCPFKEKPAMTGNKGKAVWMRPSLVCNVKYSNITQEGHLRHPVFLGLREDKSGKEVTLEKPVTVSKSRQEKTETKKAVPMKSKRSTEKKDKTVKLGGKEVSLTNLDKVYWPAEKITKGELIEYYKKIGKYMLPYLKDRPQSLNRHPNGIKGSSFYQKDMKVEQLPQWAHTEKQYSKSNDEYLDYLICNDVATLIYMANLGCIEINPWHSTYQQPDDPDYMMLDLDPGKIAFEHVVDTALVIKEVCDELKIKCFCKTSGATGLHVYIPLGKKYDYDEVKMFGELLATAVHHRLPDTTSMERTVSKRKNKIYLDFLQNRKGQTIASVYSVRPRPGATVSAPLEWEEVKHGLSPQDFTIFNIEDRLKEKGDLWKGVLKKGIDLEKVLAKLEKLV